MTNKECITRNRSVSPEVRKRRPQRSFTNKAKHNLEKLGCGVMWRDRSVRSAIIFPVWCMPVGLLSTPISDLHYGADFTYKNLMHVESRVSLLIAVLENGHS
jgi:hypothetical protein